MNGLHPNYWPVGFLSWFPSIPGLASAADDIIYDDEYADTKVKISSRPQSSGPAQPCVRWLIARIVMPRILSSDKMMHVL